MGQEEILWKRFEDRNATERERVNAASTLVMFFKQKKLIPFLVDSLLLQSGLDIRDAMTCYFSSIAIEEFPEETISLLLKAIEEGRASGGSLTLTLYFRFLEKHGVDLQKGIRLHTPGKEGKEVIFIYPAEPLPEEKIKSFLNNLKPKEKEKEILIEVGRNLPYKTFDRIMTLFEQAGVYNIQIGQHSLSVRFEMSLLMSPLAIQLAKPSDKPRVHADTLFVGISPAADEKDKEKGIRFLLKPWHYECPPLEEAVKVKHKTFELKDEYLGTDEGLEEFKDFVQEKYWHFHPSANFERLPLVFVPAPETNMGTVLQIVEETKIVVKDINFLHHTRGCDWEKAIVESGKKLKEDSEKREGR